MNSTLNAACIVCAQNKIYIWSTQKATQKKRAQDMTDAKGRKKNNQPTIHSWVAAKKLRDFYFSVQKIVEKKRIALTIAKEKEENSNDGLNLWKKRAFSERIRWKCPLFHGSFVLIGDKAEKKIAYRALGKYEHSEGYSKHHQCTRKKQPANKQEKSKSTKLQWTWFLLKTFTSIH